VWDWHPCSGDSKDTLKLIKSALCLVCEKVLPLPTFDVILDGFHIQSRGLQRADGSGGGFGTSNRGNHRDFVLKKSGGVYDHPPWLLHWRGSNDQLHLLVFNRIQDVRTPFMEFQD